MSALGGFPGFRDILPDHGGDQCPGLVEEGCEASFDEQLFQGEEVGDGFSGISRERGSPGGE